MRFSDTILILSLGFVAAAQTACIATILPLPTCATSCVQSVASALGCSATDYECQCAPIISEGIQKGAAGCIFSACGPATAIEAHSSAQAICVCASEHPTSPSASTTGTVTTPGTSISGSITSSNPSSTSLGSATVSTSSVSGSTPQITSTVTSMLVPVTSTKIVISSEPSTITTTMSSPTSTSGAWLVGRSWGGIFAVLAGRVLLFIF